MLVNIVVTTDAVESWYASLTKHADGIRVSRLLGGDDLQVNREGYNEKVRSQRLLRPRFIYM